MDVLPVRALRALSGVAAAGVLVLTLVVAGAAFLGREKGFPGPGGESVAWHVVATVVVLAAQWHADRRHGFVAASAALLVFIAAIVLLWGQWWS